MTYCKSKASKGETMKIVKSKLFKEQEKKLPKKIKNEIAKAMKEIAKNPKHALNTMSVFGEPNPMELKGWANIKAEKIDLVLEYLHDKECLNEKGNKLAYDFWVTYIKEKTK